jgi:peptidoglycan/LPS O-acetylase OafA/YrhL
MSPSTHPNMSPSPPRFPAIDLLRAVSALTVLVFHVIVVTRWMSFPDHGPLLWFRISFMRVDLFFAISGFVVTLAALREWQRGDGAAGRFLWKRMARIAPLYWVTCIAFLAVTEFAVLRAPDGWLHALTHLTFTHNFFRGTMGSINGPSWTLSIEAQLYVLTALLMPLLAAWRPRLVGLLALAIGLGYRLSSQWVQTEVVGWTVQEAPLWIFSVQVPGMIDMYGIGAALALWVSRRGAPTPNALIWWAGLVVAVLLTSVFVSVLWKSAALYWHTLFWGSGFRTLVALLALFWVWLAIAMPVVWSSRLPRWLTYPGKISFGLYLWHIPVILWLSSWSGLREVPFLAATLAITGVLAALSWHWIEQPAIRWAAGRFGPASANARAST